MEQNIFYMQGPGARSDAVFLVNSNGTVRVVAERGMSACWDDTVAVTIARCMWKILRRDGWVRVTNPRRTLEQIARDARD